MEINKVTVNNVDIYEISGRIDANNSKELEIFLLENIEKGSVKMIADLKNLEYISSAGLRVFLLVVKKIGKTGFVYLSSLQPQVYQIFDISGFNNIFSIFETREAALEKA
jgi:anti-anti-sigma factor